MGFSRYCGPGNLTQVKLSGLKVSAGQRQCIRFRSISNTCSQKISCSRREDQNRRLTTSQAVEQAGNASQMQRPSRHVYDTLLP